MSTSPPPSLASPELSAIMSRAPSLGGDPRSAASSLLAPAISAAIERLGTLVQHAVVRDAVCQSLEAECAVLEGQLRAARANILQQKAAQRRLRADIAAFIRERGKTRCAALVPVPLRGDDMRASGVVVFGMLTPRTHHVVVPSGDSSLIIAREVKIEEEDVSIPLTPMLSNAGGAGGDSAKTAPADYTERELERFVEDSPLLLRSKRRGTFSPRDTVLPGRVKRRRLASDDGCSVAHAHAFCASVRVYGL
ncbi:hypothetical protein C8Q74DRAFT_1222244 [Fomes fomentarius]|nr:hypothetical protein C8Q74DRAFT_1222244 [Fomes fomentarius]